MIYLIALTVIGQVAASPSFSKWAPMPSPRRGGVGGILFDKSGAPNVYVTGGSNAENNVEKSVAIYDAAYDEWREEADLLVGRSDHSAAPLGESLYVGGGASACDSENTCSLSSVEMFTPSTGKWTNVASMNTARRGLSFASDEDSGMLYAIGGMSCPSTCVGESVEYLSTLEVYDTENDIWSTLPSMPTPRRDFGVAIVDSILYAVGGCGGDGSKLDIDHCEALDTVEKYDPVTKTWTSLAPMPTPRRGFAMGQYGTQLIVAGGSEAAGWSAPADSNELTKTVLSYDSINDAWYTLTRMPDPRDGLVKGYNMFLGISMFLISGSSADSAYEPTTELMALMCYTPSSASAQQHRGINVSMPLC
jgi:N-acetylneuraminic acid mutarotase